MFNLNNGVSLTIFAGLGLSISLIIETLSWTVRSLSDRGSIGFYISRTNIFLYGGRFFNLIFVTLVSFMIDKGIKTEDIIFASAVAFGMATFIHFPLILSKEFENRASIYIGKLLNLTPCINVINGRNIVNRRLLIYTLLSTLIFSLGLSLPYTLASIIPEFRMTMSNISQIINSLGTLLLLFIVDPILYALLDKNKLNECIGSYVRGRFFGFGFSGILLLSMYSLL